ncbi:helix-hairpin-helix domain-containing protein [Natrinema versiforme]|uniref:Helix-hairpin-helix domain-containing protein n=1 Tax=Natrinema versiforme TaxID=88724 RepID=A0A4V1FZM2_9EURY|nr:helix-hairpin-helix domain-containing protein [Natrinema versiforme]QCS42336.1 hypothetical protein FEJ81_08170 [Natrinema versiforme]
MCARLSESSVGKTVESANGEVIGTVAAVEGDTAVVEPNPGVMDSIKAALGWERAHEDTVMVHEDAIETTADDVIRLESDPEAPNAQTGTDEPAHSPETDDPTLETEGGSADSDGLERDVATDREQTGDEGITEVERAGPASNTERTEPTDQTTETGGADEPADIDETHPAADTAETGTEPDESAADTDPLRTEERGTFEAPSAADEAVDTDARDGLEETAAIDETATIDGADSAETADTAGPTGVEGTDQADESVDEDDFGEPSWNDETPATGTTADSTEDTPDQGDRGEQGVPDEAASTVDMADERGVTDGETPTESEPDDGAVSDDRSDSETDLADAVTGGVDGGSLEDVSDGLDDADERNPTADVNLADELDTGIDIESVDEPGDTDTVAADAETGDDTSNVVDRLDRSPDLESVVESDEPDERERDAGSRAAAETDLADELETGPDLESVAEADRDPGADIGPDAIEGEPTDTGGGVEAVDRRIVTDEADGIDHRPAETAGDRDRTALEDLETESETAPAEASSTDDDRSRPSGPFSAAVALQRAALKPGTQAIEHGLEFQRELARSALSGQVALQRQQLALLETAASAPFEIAAAMSESDEREVGGRLELVDGVDAMYRKRLVDAGITSLDDLARADVETVAEAAAVTEKRAAGWIEQADG